jgi:hypothetical protein
LVLKKLPLHNQHKTHTPRFLLISMAFRTRELAKGCQSECALQVFHQIAKQRAFAAWFRRVVCEKRRIKNI